MSTAQFAHRPSRLALAGAVGLLLVLAACQPSSSASPSGSAGATEHPVSHAPSEAASAGPSAPASATPTPGPQSGEITVTIVGTSFGPDLTITAGSSVVFVNTFTEDHSVTNGVDGVADPNAAFDFAVPAGETSDPLVFDTPGTYNVTCKPHPTMNLVITVV